MPSLFGRSEFTLYCLVQVYIYHYIPFPTEVFYCIFHQFMAFHDQSMLLNKMKSYLSKVSCFINITVRDVRLHDVMSLCLVAEMVIATAPHMLILTLVFSYSFPLDKRLHVVNVLERSVV